MTQENQAAEGAALPAVRQTVDIGRIVTDLDGVWRLAQNMAASSLVPKDFHKQPANILVAIQLGAEIGLAPMQALQSIAVINGRPSLWGDGLLGLVMANPLFEGIDETFDEATKTARCELSRKGWRKPIVRTFSEADAQKAGLLNKDTYKQYLRRMLQMRARAWALRDGFADVLRGLQVAEEMQDAPASGAEAVVESVSKVADMMPVITKLDQIGGPARKGQPDGPAMTGAGAAPVSKDTDDAELMAEAGSAAAASTPAPVQEVAFITENDRRKLMGAARSARVTVDQLKAWLFKKHGIASSKEIRVDQFAAIEAAVAGIPAELKALEAAEAK